MAVNLKNPEVERLAEEVARMTGETKTEAVRRARWSSATRGSGTAWVAAGTWSV
ncbi:MAG: type II toxin-antitoxin system VapB family antitoxin [Acidimicrobiales bacterium]